MIAVVYVGYVFTEGRAVLSVQILVFCLDWVVLHG